VIIYDLICDSKHEFEGWFNSANDLDEQRERGLLSCPICDSHSVHKKLTAAKLKSKSNASQISTEVPQQVGNTQSPAQYAQVQKMLGKLHDYIETNFENVGNRFTDEALSIHRGEKDAANIYGTASKKQMEQLKEEGVETLQLPAKPFSKDELN